METHLKKYDAYDITTPKKMIIQNHPADFRDVNAAEVYFVDFKTKLSATTQVLLDELTQKMGVPEKHMVVRNATDPIELEPEKEAKYTARLTDSTYSEVDHKSAKKAKNEYVNSSFLKELEKQAKDRRKSQEYKVTSK
jgi:hypothetical protein